MKRILIIGFMAAMAAGCSQDKSKKSDFGSRPEVQASEEIQQSLSVRPRGLRANAGSTDVTSAGRNHDLVIQKAALDKEFLLQSNIIVQVPVAQPSGNRSRVVAFTQRGSRVFLLEATQGHSVSADIPQNIILAEMPVLAEDNDTLTVDFNAGMSRLFVGSEWAASDFEGRQYSTQNWVALQVTSSFIQDARYEGNTLVLRQITQVEAANVFGQGVQTPAEVKYYLSPYRPDPTFQPTLTTDNFDRQGYFEVSPYNLGGQIDVIHATRWNVNNKKIVFAVSANTPADYKQAVKDGILYWNKVFGRDVIEVVDAPAGVTAPDATYNVVQWVDWSSAGFAYADAQMDPRTGEILHAQVFMTSVFAVSGKNKARDLIQVREAQAEQKTARISLRGFEPETMCDRHMDHSFANRLVEMLTNPTDDATVLKLSQDYVREVIAHEIGHTLGLRHNFAGSLAANYDLKDREELFNRYLTDGQTPAGLVASSSVMEYQDYEESVMTGDQIARQTAALDYDTKAIATLYNGQQFDYATMPLFCTDSHTRTGLYNDCATFDIGKSPIEYAAWRESNIKKDTAKAILSIFMAAKVPRSGNSRPLSQVRLPTAAVVADYMVGSRIEWLGRLVGKGGFLKIHRQEEVVSPEVVDTILTNEVNFLNSEVTRVGGLSVLLPRYEQGLGQELTTIFQELLQKYADGIGWNEQAYQFSAAEQQTMMTRVQRLFAQVENEYFKSDIKTLKTPPAATTANVRGEASGRFVNSPVSNEFLNVIEARVREYGFKASGRTIAGVWTKTETVNGTTTTTTQNVQLPEFAYSFEVRKAGMALRSGITGEDMLFAYNFASRLTTQYDDILKNIFGATAPKESELNEPALRWYLEYTGAK